MAIGGDDQYSRPDADQILRIIDALGHATAEPGWTKLQTDSFRNAMSVAAHNIGSDRGVALPAGELELGRAIAVLTSNPAQDFTSSATGMQFVIGDPAIAANVVFDPSPNTGGQNKKTCPHCGKPVP